MVTWVLPRYSRTSYLSAASTSDQRATRPSQYQSSTSSRSPATLRSRISTYKLSPLSRTRLLFISLWKPETVTLVEEVNISLSASATASVTLIRGVSPRVHTSGSSVSSYTAGSDTLTLLPDGVTVTVPISCPASGFWLQATVSLTLVILSREAPKEGRHRPGRRIDAARVRASSGFAARAHRGRSGVLVVFGISSHILFCTWPSTGGPRVGYWGHTVRSVFCPALA